ncbi:MAG: IMP dehydrogenase, partial [Methanobacteriaceae archaeon]|nr:IMP dehydrogenase [Methanobacteriaceae archaeon]
MYSRKLKEAETAYTFDDFLLVPQASLVEPKDVIIKSRVSKNHEINVPIISSAMDTVTESEMAIAMAQEGGLGIIHRNMSIKDQVEQVKKVKRSGDLTIRDVITINPDASLREAHEIMEREGISGLPVVDNGKILGIISRRDIEPIINSEAEKKVEEVMTKEV